MALVAGYGSSSEEDEDDAAPDNKLGSLVAYGDDDDDDDDDGGNNGATAKAAKSAEAPQSTSGDGGAAAATAASAAASSAASTAESWQPGKGDTVIRKGQECIVIHIDYALDPPGYTLRLPDGREVGTELNRLERPAATVAATAKSERRRTEDRTDASRSQAVGPAIGTAATASAATAVRSGGSRSSRSSRIKKGVEEEEEEEEEKVLLPPEPEGLPAEPAGSCDRDLAKKLAQFHALRAEGNNFTATLQSKREFGNPYILQKAKDHFAIDGAGSNYPRETFDPQAFGSGEFIEQLEARRRRREEQLAAERNMRQMQGAVHHLYNAAAPAQAPAPAPALAPAPAPAPPVPAAAPVVAPVMPGTIAGAGAGAAGGDGGSAATAAAPALASHGGNTGGARKRKKREWGTVAGRR